MVRNLVGTLMVVGRGRQGADWPAAVLAKCDRTQAGETAPAWGLTLVSVGYPPPFDWEGNGGAVEGARS